MELIDELNDLNIIREDKFTVDDIEDLLLKGEEILNDLIEGNIDGKPNFYSIVSEGLVLVEYNIDKGLEYAIVEHHEYEEYLYKLHELS